VVWGICRRRSTLTIVLTLLATAIAMLTPPIRSAQWVGLLHVWLQWYLRPAGDQTVFTAFPWAGFVLAGGAVGSLLARVGGRWSERRLQLGIAAAGAALIAGGFYAASLPSLYRESSFWTSSPAYFAIRVGVVMTVLAVAYGLDAVLSAVPLLGPLERMGRSSLFIYWIHVELVYGYASWPLWRKLTIPQALAAYVLFCGLMYGALILRDRFVGARRARGDGARLVEVAQAQ